MSDSIKSSNLKWLTEEFSSLLTSFQLALDSFTSASSASSSSSSSSSSSAGDSLNLIQLYLNPLYLFPIIFVMFTGLLVYVFGFKSTSSVPPTLHLFVDKDNISSSGGVNKLSNKSTKLNKKEKNKQQEKQQQQQQQQQIKEKDNKVTANKQQQDEQTQSSKTKSDNGEQLKSSMKQSNKSEQTNKDIKATKKSKVNTKTEKIDTKLMNGDGVGVSGDDGEWVQIVSRKVKKVMKPGKEEAAGKSGDEVNEKESPKVKTTVNAVPVNPAQSPAAKKKAKKTKAIETKVDTKSTPVAIPVNTVADEPVAVDKNIVPRAMSAPSNEELMAQVPEYVMAKEVRAPAKKSAKQTAQKAKRNSEIDSNTIKPVNTDELNNDEKANTNTDKITAAIIKSYEGDLDEKKANKNANQTKKKKANKSNNGSSIANHTNANITSNNNNNNNVIVGKTVIANEIEAKLINEKPAIVNADNLQVVNHSGNENALTAENESKKMEEDDGFKIPVNRKKRSRRE